MPVPPLPETFYQSMLQFYALAASATENAAQFKSALATMETSCLKVIQWFDVHHFIAGRWWLGRQSP